MNTFIEPLVSASRAIDKALDDHASRAANLVGKLAQTDPAMSKPNAIELYKLRLIKLKRNARPERIDVVGRRSRRHGDRHDSIHRQIECARGSVHGGSDRGGRAR